MAQSTPSTGSSRQASAKGKGGPIQDGLDLPEKFKEEDRLFMGMDDVKKQEKEQGIMGKMFDSVLHGSMKFTLEHLEAMIKKNSISEVALDQHIRRYMKKDEKMLVQHLKCIAQMLIQQSRVPGQGMGTQVVLLFKAIDCLRMATQYAPSGADNIPSFVTLQIMAKMPPAFVPHMNREKSIFNLYIALQRAVKEKLPTINVRNKLASLYVKQKCYADALFQYERMLEYFSSKKPQSPAVKEKLCVLHLNIGDMYKSIFSFQGDFKNGQILQNFVFRYNREADIQHSSRTKIHELSGPINKMTVKDLYKDLQQLSVNHYEAALKYFPADKNRKKRSEVLVVVGKNYAEMGRHSEAGESLRDSLLLLGKERNSPDIFQNKEEVLDVMHASVGKMPPGPKQEKLKSFVVRERNKLDSDKMEWEEQQKKKDEIRKEAERGGKKKVVRGG